MRKDASVHFCVLHEQIGCIVLAMAKYTCMIEANFVSIAVNCVQDAISFMLSSTLKVLMGLISSINTFKSCIIDRWLKECVAGSWLDLLISHLLEFFICISLEYTVNKVVGHALLTLRLSTHKGVRLFAENVKATL